MKLNNFNDEKTFMSNIFQINFEMFSDDMYTNYILKLLNSNINKLSYKKTIYLQRHWKINRDISFPQKEHRLSLYISGK